MTESRRHPGARPAGGRWPALGTSAALALASLGVGSDARAQTFTVDFSSKLGAPTYRASGFIYGLSEDATQPPQHFVSDIKTQFLRVGGAQLGCPSGGWVNSTSNYTRRWNTVQAYYGVAKAVGAKVILLVHDLWGADLVCTVNEFPGDGGNWTRFNTFINQVVNDAKAAGMTGSDVIWDLWNEPDCCGFWGDRAQSQYLEMWKRSYQAVRAALPSAIISGPSSSGQPAGGNGWFTAYLDYIKSNNVIPDYLSWHQLPGPDPNSSKSTADSWLSSRGITVKGYQINEYGSPGGQQGAAGSAWYIGRLDRLGIDGARANWGMYGGLWDTMGELVVNGSGALGAWWVYKRYADTTGQRVAISSNNSQWDGAAGTDSSKANAIIVLGNNLSSGGPYTITLNLTRLDQASYLVANNQVRALVERIPETGRTPVSAPTTVSNQNYAVTNNQASITISWGSANDSYAVTLTGSTGGTGTGGTASGGVATGGKATGGTPTGGTSTGGKATGGTSTGGTTTTSGGASTGGRATGGALVPGGTGGVSGIGGSNVGGGGGQGGGGEETCNCRTAGGTSTGAGWLGALGLLLLARARRRTAGRQLSAGKPA